MISNKDFDIIAESIRCMLNRDHRFSAAIAVASAALKIDPWFDLNEFYKNCGVLID